MIGWNARREVPMIAELVRRHADVMRLCELYGVTRLDVFGSAVDGGFDAARGDVDFLVELDPPPGMSRFDAYFGLKESLESLLGHPVDLVAPSALANPYFAEAVGRSRESIYAV
jgi:predicted nucleotidyltransferase